MSDPLPPCPVDVSHELKCWPYFYQAVLHGRKPFEVRKNDRDYMVKNRLILNEWDNAVKKYTGRVLSLRLTYVLRDAEAFGVQEGYVVLGFDPHDVEEISK